MGIDICFTDESLKGCKQALCRTYRSNIVGLYSEPPKEGNDELAPYREQSSFLNLALLQQEEPHLHKLMTKDSLPVFSRDALPWHNSLPGRYGIRGADARRLKGYVESKPSAKVYLRKMPRELADKLLAETGEGDIISAWYDMPFEKHDQICRPCAVRPLDEDNCYIRFSSYPGMSSFKHGFSLAVLYSIGIDKEKLKGAYFSFPHLNREANELPKDKIGELFEMCKDSPVNKGAEIIFNSVVEMLEKMKPPDTVSDMSKIDTQPMPFVDEFISTYIYREKPYSIEDSRTVLPYLETLLEVADWAIWDTNDEKLRRPVIAFRNRFKNFITALKIADKYELEVRMSY